MARWIQLTDLYGKTVYVNAEAATAIEADPSGGAKVHLPGDHTVTVRQTPADVFAAVQGKE